MQRTKVRSSDLESVGYDEMSAVLEIEFKSGGVYQYSGVPPNIHSYLMSAASHGKYFHKHIRDGYPTIKIK